MFDCFSANLILSSFSISLFVEGLCSASEAFSELSRRSDVY
jgi:hypothetical protein